MKTLTVDDYQRVRLPDAKPRSKFAYEQNGGTILLTRLVEDSSPKARLVRRGGRTFAETTRTITNEDVARELENFP